MTKEEIVKMMQLARNINIKDESISYYKENMETIADMLKDKYGITDSDIKDLNPEEFKKLLRNKKLKDIL